MNAIVCSVEGCDRMARTVRCGLCDLHYRRKLTNGDPNKVCYNRTGITRKYPREYCSWQEMKTRCHNRNRKHNKCYFENNIKICDRWLEKPNGFKNFLEDMGPKPSYDVTENGHPVWTIDRIDPLGDYSPDNCRWANNIQQNINKESIKTPYIAFRMNRYIVRIPRLKICKRFKTLEEAKMFRKEMLDNDKQSYNLL